MPIVASMGGIAATQTLGIYIRAEAMRQLNRKNIRYLFRREFIVALANCFVFSIAIYLITVFWFGNSLLSFAISAAMIFNLLAAAIFGFSLPHPPSRQSPQVERESDQSTRKRPSPTQQFATNPSPDSRSRGARSGEWRQVLTQPHRAA